MHSFRRLLLLTLVPIAAGCSSDDDDERFTDHYPITALSGSYGAFADEANLRILAAVLGEKGFARLRGGDTIEIDVNGTRMATYERQLEDKVHYIVDMPPPAQETEIVITFVRGVSRVSSKIRIYSAFQLKDPPATVKTGESAPIDIDPRPDLSKWPGFFGPGLVAKAEVIGECLETGANQIPLCAMDSPAGECKQGYPLKLDTSRLVFRPGVRSCEVGIQVRLTSNGANSAPPSETQEKFKGGGFEGYRLRNFRMKITE
jgi:hypothetical protein